MQKPAVKIGKQILGFITQYDYESDHFRIGMALNPSLEKRLRYQSVYDKVVNQTEGRTLADELWDVWKRGRNLVFHYFPHNYKSLSLTEAEEIVENFLSTMEKAVKLLKISNS